MPQNLFHKPSLIRIIIQKTQKEEELLPVKAQYPVTNCSSFRINFNQGCANQKILQQLFGANFGSEA